MFESLIRQAEIHKENYEWEQAESAYRSAVKIAEESGNFLALADCLHLLGVFHRDRLERDNDAELFLKQALSIRELLHGAVHADVGMTLLVLGEVDLHAGRVSESKENCRRALQIFEELNDDRFAEALEVLTRCYNSSDKAIEVVIEVIQRRESTGGPFDKLLAHALWRWAKYLADNKQEAEAVVTLRRACWIFQENDSQLFLAKCLWGLGDLFFQKLGNFDDAEATLLMALEVAQKAADANSMLCEGICRWLARLYSTAYFEGSKWDEAEKFYERSVAICEIFATKPHEKWNLWHALVQLSRFLERAGKLERADELLRRSMERQIIAPSPFRDFYDIPDRLRLLLKLRKFAEAQELVDGNLKFFQSPDLPIFQELAGESSSPGVPPPPMTLREAISGSDDLESTEHSDTLINQFCLKLKVDLAEIRRAEGKKGEVAVLCRQVLSAEQPVFVDEYGTAGLYRLLNFVNQLAYIGWIDDFEYFLKEAIAVALGSDIQFIGIMVNDIPEDLLRLSVIIAEYGDRRRAELLVDQALALYKQHRPPGSLLYAYLLEECALLLRNGPLHQKAEQLLSEATMIRSEGIDSR